MPRGRHAVRADRRVGPGRLAVPVLAALVLLGSARTWAYWTDAATVTGGALTAGTMDLQVNGEAVGVGTDLTVATLTTDDLTPGEAQAFALTVGNVGAPDLTWTATATRAASPTWTYSGDPLRVTLHAGTPLDDAAYPRVDTCSGAALGPAVVISAASDALTLNSQPLAAGDSSAVCVLVAMISTADNANQGATGALRMTFDGVQVIP